MSGAPAGLARHNAGMTAASPPAGNLGLPGLHSPAAGFDQPFEMLAACHERVRRSLDLLARLLAHLQQLAVAGRLPESDADARSAAADVWRYFEVAAPQHHADEERHVIPRLLASGDAPLVDAARRMLDDHQAFRTLWAQLGPQLAALQAGQAPDLPRLHHSARAFIARHAEHLPLEDDLAFPAAQRALDTAGQQAMGHEMARRRRPPDA